MPGQTILTTMKTNDFEKPVGDADDSELDYLTAD